MHKLCTKGFRLAGLMAMAMAVAHCGDSSVNVVGGGNINPTRGTFSGTTGNGGIVTLGVGSVESATLVCAGQAFGGACDPVLDVIENTAIGTCSGIDIDVTFTSNDQVVINDISAGTNCDGSGNATRDTSTSPGTPTTTPTGSVPTPTFTITPDPNDSGPTMTPGPGVTTPAPTPTPCVGPDCCPEAARVEGMGGAAQVLDSGWTGLGHNATVVDEGVLTVSLDCTPAVRPCGTCSVSGPIPNVHADDGSINNQRCSLDTAIKCTSDGDCGGDGPCRFFFGSPLPLTAGGISTCVVNEVTGGVSGTGNVETGSFQTGVSLTSSVFTQVELSRPCPTCDGDPTPNDGVAGGTCNGGPDNGNPCDVNGSSPVPAFGSTSLDCSPGVKGTGIAALPIDLSGSSGTETLEITSGSPNCTAFGFNPNNPPFVADGKCPCSAAGGEPTRPNPCINAVCDDVGGGQGECMTAGPFDQNCAPLETFRGCLADSDCTGSDTCAPRARSCFLDNGFIGGTIDAQGNAGVPSNGVSNSIFAATFCIDNTSSGAVNAAAGLPGPGRIELPIETREIVNGVVAGF